MNYKVEIFIDHWHDDGLIFGTREEAVEHALKQSSGSVRRIVETSDRANYQMKDGKLVPGTKRFDPATCTWEEYIKQQSGDQC